MRKKNELSKDRVPRKSVKMEKRKMMVKSREVGKMYGAEIRSHPVRLHETELRMVF